MRFCFILSTTCSGRLFKYLNLGKNINVNIFLLLVILDIRVCLEVSAISINEMNNDISF